MEHVSLGLRIELVLHVAIIFVQGLHFLICIATALELYTCVFLAGGCGEANVKLAIAALLKVLRERNFVSISLLSDGEGAIALFTDIVRYSDY